jgi:hypothetical protein
MVQTVHSLHLLDSITCFSVRWSRRIPRRLVWALQRARQLEAICRKVSRKLERAMARPWPGAAGDQRAMPGPRTGPVPQTRHGARWNRVHCTKKRGNTEYMKKDFLRFAPHLCALHAFILFFIYLANRQQAVADRRCARGGGAVPRVGRKKDYSRNHDCGRGAAVHAGSGPSRCDASPATFVPLQCCQGPVCCTKQNKQTNKQTKTKKKKNPQTKQKRKGKQLFVCV